jgi:hypothetical protein
MTIQDSSRLGASQNLAFNAAGGGSVASAAFGTQTYQVRVTFTGPAGNGVRITVGDGTPTAGASSTLLPAGWVEYLTVTPGQKLAAISDTATAGTLSITELAG